MAQMVNQVEKVLIPTSAIGRSKAFTLTELIVVVFLIALIASFILLRVSNVNFNAGVHSVARQLKAFVEITQEQAILQQNVLGLEVSQDGYQVYALDRLTQSLWQPMSDDASFWKRRPIPNDVLVVVTHSGDTKLIVFYPSGEISPFELTIAKRGQKPSYRLMGNQTGALILENFAAD